MNPSESLAENFRIIYQENGKEGLLKYAQESGVAQIYWAALEFLIDIK